MDHSDDRMNGGLPFHCYHDSLVDYVEDYQKRVDYIKVFKRKEEHELRLRLFKIISEDYPLFLWSPSL